MTKHCLKMMMVVLFLFACGGSPGGSESRSVHVEIDMPASLTTLSEEESIVTLTLSKLTEGVEGNEVVRMNLESVEGGIGFEGLIDKLQDGFYRARFYISYRVDSSTIPVAVFELDIEVVKGQAEIIINIGPSDFSIDIDSDEETGTRLNICG